MSSPQKPTTSQAARLRKAFTDGLALDRSVTIKRPDALRQHVAEVQRNEPVGQAPRMGRSLEMKSHRSETSPPPSPTLRALAEAAQEVGRAALGYIAPPQNDIPFSPRPTPVGGTNELGALVRSRRNGEGLNQQELAQKAGVGRRFVSELESGKPTLEIGKVLAVCAALGLTLQAVRAADAG